MRWLLLFLTLFSLPLQSCAQKAVRDYVQRNVVPIASIQPDLVEFSDLDAVGAAIGDARIVMLGEQDHGDGATFLAKTRLIKYLHEEKGFNVLAFEADFFGLNEGWSQLPKEDKEIRAFLRWNIYPVWSACRQCEDLLYSYIPSTHQTDAPLEITGFDSRLVLKHSVHNLKEYIVQRMQQEGIAYTQSKGYGDRFLPLLDSLMHPKLRPALFQEEGSMKELEQSLDTILSRLREAGAGDFELLVLESLGAQIRQARHSADYTLSNTIRDRQMAENLNWLAREKYPNEKIIVWAANAHIMKNADTALKFKNFSFEWMGTVFTKDSLNASQTYVLGFTSRDGSYRRVHEREARGVPKPLRNGFETWMEDSLRYGFVDFRRFRDEHPTFSDHFPMKGHGQLNSIGTWTDVFDGVFYIRDMIPRETKEEPEGLH